jgi:hypothetical protein
LAEARGDDVAAERQRLGLLVQQRRVRDLVVVVERVAGDRLEHQRPEEERQEPERQAVIAHQWWVKPITV